LTFAAGTQEYLGIGTDVIARAFEPSGVATWAFAWKLVFTSVTLASGFKGGEVTPLFFIGATLGCTLAGPLGLPGDWLAAMGLAAVFGAAANTPLACTAMGIELFGGAHGVPLAVACAASYVLSGHRGIYLSQRLDTGKADEITESAAGATLRDIRETAGRGPPKADEPGR
jgi:H+/Cl- antiporter ClcA